MFRYKFRIYENKGIFIVGREEFEIQAKNDDVAEQEANYYAKKNFDYDKFTLEIVDCEEI